YRSAEWLSTTIPRRAATCVLAEWPRRASSAGRRLQQSLERSCFFRTRLRDRPFVRVKRYTLRALCLSADWHQTDRPGCEKHAAHSLSTRPERATSSAIPPPFTRCQRRLTMTR